MSQADALLWLTTPEGERLLEAAVRLPNDRLTRLTRLRRHVSVERAAAVVELLELRRRARPKFALADRMLFTSEGLEQSTGEVVARYRASQFPVGVGVLDACCGIGGDALAFGARGLTLAVDTDSSAAVCARANASLSDSVTNSVRVLCADVTTLALSRLREAGIGAAFFDPSRRVDSREGVRRRASTAEDYTPPLSWLECLREHFPAVAVKISPAIDDETLHRSPQARVEFVSVRGECKEALLWFGELADSDQISHIQSNAYAATVLTPDGTAHHLTPQACELPPLSAPKAWLYEPDPAVIRAHLVPQIAGALSASLLDPTIAYLTAEKFVSMPFADAYQVLDWLPFQLKNVQARLKALGRNVVAIKKRGVPQEPEALRKKLNGTGQAGDPPAVVVLSRHNGQVIAILCARVHGDSSPR